MSEWCKARVEVKDRYTRFKPCIQLVLEMDGETAVLVAGIIPNKVSTAKGATSASSAILITMQHWTLDLPVSGTIIL